ncbi:hypothetical protein V5O48_004584 [Marasmius crinis-equi]|uniref:Cytochrome P450 n=1 Tax=Marasmius crinis-equi TaxID=585013 RepID=A0ABR3FPP4_9AGAR
MVTPPSHLKHIPRVPILPLVYSYLTREVDDVRIKRLILPLRAKGEKIVLVWVLGRWMVHILDFQVAKELCDDTTRFPKETPDDASLLWRFVGKKSLLMSNGEQWRKQSALINDAFAARVPVDTFVVLSRRLFSIIGHEDTVQWDVMAQRFALDAVGSTILGHDFDAIRTQNAFVGEYNGVMEAIADPMYLIFPRLERTLPRRGLISRIDNLVNDFMALLNAKQADPGDDMMTYMLRDPAMSFEELRDNMIVLFIGGHDTAAGSISTLFYYLARYPAVQARARAEVLHVLGAANDPDVETLSGKSLPYLTACIREAMRINTAVSYIVPRKSSLPVELGGYVIPAQTSIIVDICAIHHSDEWPSPVEFRPERFLGSKNRGLPWLPFALGPRQCPARNFAMYEQRALAAMFLREYEWHLPDKSPHRDNLKNSFSPFALTLPQNLSLRFRRLASQEGLPHPD